MKENGKSDAEKTLVKAIRSPQQQEAARKNGAKGRGPRTPQGKAVSAMNGMKHGIYAMGLPPHADYRGDDVVYRNLIAQICRDYPPRSISDNYTIQYIAYAMVSQRRLRRAHELRMMPKPLQQLPDSALERIQMRQECLALRAAVRKSYDQISSGSFPGLSHSAAASLAKECLTVVSMAKDAKVEADRPERTKWCEESEDEPSKSSSPPRKDWLTQEDCFLFDPRTQMNVVQKRLLNTNRDM